MHSLDTPIKVTDSWDETRRTTVRKTDRAGCGEGGGQGAQRSVRPHVVASRLGSRLTSRLIYMDGGPDVMMSYRNDKWKWQPALRLHSFALPCARRQGRTASPSPLNQDRPREGRRGTNHPRAPPESQGDIRREGGAGAQGGLQGLRAAGEGRGGVQSVICVLE